MSYTPNQDPYREGNRAMRWGWRWLIILFLTLLVLGFIAEAAGYAVLPYFLRFERQAVENSRQYNVGINEQLSHFKESYLDADTQSKTTKDSEAQDALVAQKMNALREMRRVIDKAGRENVSADYLVFYDAHIGELDQQ